MALTLVLQVTFFFLHSIQIFFLHSIQILRHDFKQLTTHNREKADLLCF